MNGLSLFSGSGIGELALSQIIPKYRTVGYVEWEAYCQEVIRARIKDGVLHDAPIFGDIREFNDRYAESYVGKVDIISGGFPCQPFSVAGKGAGEHDPRNMWPDTLRSISIIRPRYCLLENVPGLLAHDYIRTIFGGLAEIGYDCEWDIVGASDCGAPHRRKRLWIIANSKRNTIVDGVLQEGRRKMGRCERIWGKDWQQSPVASRPIAILREWQGESLGESPLVRMDDGIPDILDRLKALGNGWVPQVVRRILEVR